MKRNAFINTLEYMGVLIFCTIWRLQGLRYASWLGGCVGRFFGPFLKNHKFAKYQLEKIFPEKSKREIESILEEMWDNMGRIPPEYVNLDQMKIGKEIFLEGEENIKVLSQKKPLIFIGAHIGNLALPCLVANKLGISTIKLYRQFNNPLVDQKIAGYQTRAGIPSIHKGAQGAKDAMVALKKGTSIVFLCDQRLDEGDDINFLGYPARTPSGPIKIGTKLQIPIIPVQVIRHPGEAKFTVKFHPALETQNRPVEKILEEMNNLFSQWITAHPGQWLWVHRRWGRGFLKKD